MNNVPAYQHLYHHSRNNVIVLSHMENIITHTISIIWTAHARVKTAVFRRLGKKTGEILLNLPIPASFLMSDT